MNIKEFDFPKHLSTTVLDQIRYKLIEKYQSAEDWLNSAEDNGVFAVAQSVRSSTIYYYDKLSFVIRDGDDIALENVNKANQFMPMHIIYETECRRSKKALFDLMNAVIALDCKVLDTYTLSDRKDFSHHNYTNILLSIPSGTKNEFEKYSGLKVKLRGKLHLN